jgi:transposase, IS5 family
MVGAVCADRAGLSEAGQWPPASWGRADAAPLFLAAMVQPIGPGGEGGALRFAGDAAFCRHRPPPSRGQALGREPVPDETTVCRFRHLLEEHELGRQLFDEVQRHPAAKGLKVTTGTIVDATIINAPSSTKKCRQDARSRDAPDKQGKPVVFQHEGAFWDRQPHQTDPRSGGDPSQCRRQHGAAPSVARERNPRVGRPGVSQSAGGDPPARTASAGLCQQPRSPSRCRGRGRASENRTKSKVRAKVEHPIGVIR